MNTFAVKEKRTLPVPRNRSQPSRFGYRGPEVKAQQTEIHHILRSTGAHAKLTIGQPNDKYEQEADRVADQVVQMSDTNVAQRVETGTVQPVRIQRMCSECKDEQELQRKPEEDEEMLQAKEMPGQTAEVRSGIESRINSLKGGGQPLNPATRAFFEPRFGHDFSQVWVHTDHSAAESTHRLNARAYTVGRDIVFGTGQYAPGTARGKRLLAHELTHVVQQNGAVLQQIQRQSTGYVDPCQAFNYRNCMPLGVPNRNCINSEGHSSKCMWSGAVRTGCICRPSAQLRGIELLLLFLLLLIMRRLFPFGAPGMQPSPGTAPPLFFPPGDGGDPLIAQALEELGPDSALAIGRALAAASTAIETQGVEGQIPPEVLAALRGDPAAFRATFSLLHDSGTRTRLGAMLTAPNTASG